MKLSIIKSRVESHYVSDPYLPAVAVIGEECDFVEFVGYCRGDCGLAELQVSRGEGTICQVTLTLCDWFEVRSGHLSVPDAVEGLLAIEGGHRIESDSLFVTIYDDGLDLALSGKIPMSYVRSGDVIFGISADEEVCKVLLVNQANNETEHAKRLLVEDWEARRAES